MLFTSSLLSLLAAVSVSAAPALTRRTATDILVFRFADVLEQLESQFYQQALSKFQTSDFTAAGFASSQVAIEQFQVIQTDEASHSTALQAALKSFGAEPITTCKFKFDSALTDVATMAATARVVEAVGVGAYLGAAPLLSDPVLLVAAGSILTIEARHQTVLNLFSTSGTTIPSAFDFALTPAEVLTLALPFIDTSCPCDVGITPQPILKLTNTGNVGVGTLLTFASDALNSTVDQSTFFCQMLVGGVTASIALPLSQCIVPAGINGPVAVWITSDGQPLLNNPRDRATTQLVAGPLLANIDSSPQLLVQLARGSGVAGAAVSTSTQTISPAQASGIIASQASAAPVAASPTGATADGSITVMGMNMVSA